MHETMVLKQSLVSSSRGEEMETHWNSVPWESSGTKPGHRLESHYSSVFPLLFIFVIFNVSVYWDYFTLWCLTSGQQTSTPECRWLLAHTHTYIHLYTHTYSHILMYIHSHTNTDSHIHIHSHTLTHTNSYTYTHASHTLVLGEHFGNTTLVHVCFGVVLRS